MDGNRNKQLDKLISNLRIFINKEDHMTSMANRIEVALDELFPEEEIVQNFVVDLAQYSPSGGDYLLSFDEILPRAKSVLKWLEVK